MDALDTLPDLERELDTYWDETRTCHVVRNVDAEGNIDGWLVKDTVGGADYPAGNLAQARHRVRFILTHRDTTET